MPHPDRVGAARAQRPPARCGAFVPLAKAPHHRNSAKLPAATAIAAANAPTRGSRRRHRATRRTSNTPHKQRAPQTNAPPQNPAHHTTQGDGDRHPSRIRTPRDTAPARHAIRHRPRHTRDTPGDLTTRHRKPRNPPPAAARHATGCGATRHRSPRDPASPATRHATGRRAIARRATARRSVLNGPPHQRHSRHS